MIQQCTEHTCIPDLATLPGQDASVLAKCGTGQSAVQLPPLTDLGTLRLGIKKFLEITEYLQAL